MKKLICAAALAGACTIAGAAQAQEALMVVRVADLNLNSPRGAAIALRRIESAAEKFCGYAHQRDLGRWALVTECRRAMSDKAVSQIGAPILTALYGKTQPALLVAEK